MRRRGPTVPLAGTAGEAGQLRAQPPRTLSRSNHVWLLHLPATRGPGHRTRSHGHPRGPGTRPDPRSGGVRSRTSSLVRLAPLSCSCV